KDRRLAFILLRKDTNFQLHISGTTRPFRKSNEEFSVKFEYHPCIYCKGLFRKQYLRRHAKKCISKPNTSGQIRSRMDHLFDKMKGDEISLEVKKDLLIAHFGKSYFETAYFL
ncbi:unnamed protein product, partial [Tenebrio molitor]